MLNGNPPHSLNPRPRAGGQPVLPRRAAAERRNTDSPDTALIDSPILYTWFTCTLITHQCLLLCKQQKCYMLFVKHIQCFFCSNSSCTTPCSRNEACTRQCTFYILQICEAQVMFLEISENFYKLFHNTIVCIIDCSIPSIRKKPLAIC